MFYTPFTNICKSLSSNEANTSRKVLICHKNILGGLDHPWFQSLGGGGGGGAQ